MKKKLVIFIICISLVPNLFNGCTTNATTGKTNINPTTVATGLAALHNALALAQVGYADYALIAGKTADPKVQAAMQIVDTQLDILGTLAYNTVNPTQADINKANAALVAVDEAKQNITK
jgi:hypothetical protein